MKENPNKNISTEKVCKKCGGPLVSNSKYEYCDTCRRKQINKKKTIGGAVLGLFLMCLSCIPVVKHFVKK